MWTDVSLEGKVDSSSATRSSSLLKLDNGQVFPAAVVAHDETKGDGVVATGFEVERLLFDPEKTSMGTRPPNP